MKSIEVLKKDLVETLDSVSDYKWGLNRLDLQEKTIVQKLQKLTGARKSASDAPSKKQKCKAL